jgi:sporulation protein YlmC with PRC-barrel domain
VSDTLKQSTHSPTIAAAKVEGSAVFDPRGERIGTIKDIYINKRTGEAEFVSMADGGVFGIGEKHHRLPWSALSYDNDLGGYVTGLEKATLKAGPVFADDLAGEDVDWRKEVSEYYGRLSPQPGGAAGLDDNATHLPHARRIDPPADDEKTDHLAEKADRAENRQEALLDEGVEESFPASDPVSVKRIT